jgi:hypothetical protein
MRVRDNPACCTPAASRPIAIRNVVDRHHQDQRIRVQSRLPFENGFVIGKAWFIVELRKKINLSVIEQPEEGARSVIAFETKEPRFKGVEGVPEYCCSSRAERRIVDNLLRFLVVSSFVVLREVPEHAFLTVPVGSIIESDHEPFLFGLLSVKLGGQEFWAFTRDLQESCTGCVATSVGPG